MVVTYNKAEIVEDENGKKSLHLELQVIMHDTKVIIKNIFPSTSNHASAESPDLLTDAKVMLSITAQENDGDLSDRLKDS